MEQAVKDNHPHISKLAVLQRKPEKEYALGILRDIAKRVSYLMREEGLKVAQLVEFYPKDKRLLGMNVNYGAKIMLRLRDPWDEARFLSREAVLGTMLHELTHNVFGPHDSKFYAKLDELRGRQWTIEQKGLFDSFVGKGRRLGSRPRSHAPAMGRRLGCGLGGLPVGRSSPREMAAQAAEKRAADNKWCGDAVRDVDAGPVGNDLEFIVIDDDEEGATSLVTARQEDMVNGRPIVKKVIEIIEIQDEHETCGNAAASTVIDLTK
ncbi:HBR486Wp [Eremothecium sinecaudum]|uniref:HBR486Wp n=1 Tax=Eremothecium sinecaudum TaxID=45286 RepID=A0A109UYC0_9SACH|nr:HBR486Wp [Eremothecium sinecaudum]AMD19387.1 HBR486Wp [Eremothecium sinecaudum]